MGELFGSTFTVRRPVTVIERNDVDGKVTPVALCFVDDQAIERFAKIRVLKCAPAADVQSGAVGERYDCVIMGKRESLYYGLLQPRSWFRIETVSETEYNAFYPLPERNNKRN